MSAVEMIGAVLMIAVSIVVTVIIMFQNPKGDGLSSLAGGSSFMSGVQDRSIDAKLNRLIRVLAVAFFVVTIAVYAFGIYL
ncbi:MAG: preprotein translocase subunit SecG [Angelakisella sp.]|mgnify:CR=1 FL=1|jgi:preprotein translocase subunit SecG|nr:preprotein translocase subunit SecG [Angelakisella sp.]